MNLREISITALVLAFCTGCIGMPPESELVDIGPERTLEIAVDPSDVLDLDIPAGEVSIRGEDIASVSALARIRCPRDSKRCAEWATDARLVSTRNGNRVRVAMNKKAKMNAAVKLTILVPKDSPLRIRMGYGELDAQGMEDDVSVEMKAGEVSIGMPRTAVEEVRLAARFGDASIYDGERALEGRRPTLVGARVDWLEGPGEHSVDVRLRYGDVQVELYP